jgi:hypothetical protein
MKDPLSPCQNGKNDFATNFTNRRDCLSRLKSDQVKKMEIDGNAPDYRSNSVGFRVVAAVPTQK